MEQGFKDAQEYWRQVVVDYIECSTDDHKDISEEDVDKITNDLLNDDHFWQEIDTYVCDAIAWLRATRK